MADRDDDIDDLFALFLDLNGPFGEFLRPTPTKLPGRPKGRLGATALAIRAAVLDHLVPAYGRMTVRQAFYRLEVAGIVEKTEAGYKQVGRQLLAMRREEELDWEFITDGTRWRRKPVTFPSARAYVEHMARGYRRDLWASQGLRFEVWLEKDALADVIVDVTTKWDVSLMVSRGQSSATFLHSAAKEAERAFDDDGIETIIYTLYDYDAGGQRAADAIARELPLHAPGVPITVERLAVTPRQIAAWSLPTRPAKKTDPQAKKWGAKPCVELDAIDPNRLVALVEGAITQHVDQRRWEIEQTIEREERAGLLALRDGFNSKPDGTV